jgi:hypothetical protein
MQIFLDESGDLGWSFDLPNQQGGSSRYITIAGIVIDPDELKHVNRYIADLYRKYNLTPKIEKKGANFSDEHASHIVRHLNKIMAKAPSFGMIAITASKQYVHEPLRKDANIFYNYMLGDLLPNTIRKYDDVELIIDKRTIKVKSGDSFEDYIKTKCWGDLKIPTNISCAYDSSDKNEGIWVADWIANFIWRKYETNRNEAYDILNRWAGKEFNEKVLFMD